MSKSLSVFVDERVNEVTGKRRYFVFETRESVLGEWTVRVSVPYRRRRSAESEAHRIRIRRGWGE